jgi:ribosome-associated translation inhibitor RaiA
MMLSLQITFRNMKPSAEIEEWILAEAEKLETFYHRIVNCRVAIEVPHRHQKKGKPLHIRIDVNLPGKEIVIRREPAAIHLTAMNREAASSSAALNNQRHTDLELIIHDAFKAAGRRIQDFARRRRGEVKKHQVVLASA